MTDNGERILNFPLIYSKPSSLGGWAYMSRLLIFPTRRSRLRWIKAAQSGIQLAESVIEGHFRFGNEEKVNVCPHKYEIFRQIFPET